MAAENVRLDDYEAAMASILQEIREAQSLNVNLETMVGKLASIHQAYATAGKALLNVAERASSTLKSLDSLKLADVPSTVNSHYEHHQKSLDLLVQAIGDAVREQQRLGLEMLQTTSANQRDFAEFTKLAADRASASQEREARIDARLSDLQSNMESQFGDINSAAQRIERTLIGSTVLVLLVIAILSIL